MVSLAPRRTHSAPPAALPEASAPVPLAEQPSELIERRRFSRPIPAAQVIEGTHADGWALWHQWSQLP